MTTDAPIRIVINLDGPKLTAEDVNRYGITETQANKIARLFVRSAIRRALRDAIATRPGMLR